MRARATVALDAGALDELGPATIRLSASVET